MVTHSPPKKIQAVNYSLVQVNIEIYKTKPFAIQDGTAFWKDPLRQRNTCKFCEVCRDALLARAEFFLTKLFFVLFAAPWQALERVETNEFLVTLQVADDAGAAAPVHSDFHHASGNARLHAH